MSRYIDADELKGALQHYKNTEDSLYYDELEMYIDDTPTADVEEVRHGAWKTEYDSCPIFATKFTCSVCGETFSTGELSDKQFIEMMKYCPNCGAKMDKE